jgi:hypothetical protein
MNEVISNIVERHDAPYARTIEEWKELKKQRHKTIRQRQLAEVTPLLNAYRRDKSVHNEHDLLKWITDALVKKGVSVYRKIWNEYPSARETWPEFEDVRMAAELQALEWVMVLWEKLKADFFEEPTRLMGHIGNYCKQFASEACKAIKPKATEIKTERARPRWSKDGDDDPAGIEYAFECYQKPPSNRSIIHSLSEPVTAKVVRNGLIVIPKGKPRDYLTGENRLFLRYCSASDVQLFQTLEAYDWDRAQAAEQLNLDLKAVNRQITRIGVKFQEMRELLIAFRLPGTNRVPFEHRDDLTERFVNFLGRMQGLTKPEFPKAFDHAYAMCAEHLPCTNSESLYEPDEVVSHLLRLWRKTQTIQ